MHLRYPDQNQTPLVQFPSQFHVLCVIIPVSRLSAPCMCTGAGVIHWSLGSLLRLHFSCNQSLRKAWLLKCHCLKATGSEERRNKTGSGGWVSWCTEYSSVHVLLPVDTSFVAIQGETYRGLVKSHLFRCESCLHTTLSDTSQLQPEATGKNLWLITSLENLSVLFEIPQRLPTKN